MAFDRRSQRLRRNALGLYLPHSARLEAAPAGIPDVGTYLTYSELTRRAPMSESEIIAQLKKMSAADCLLAIADIGVRLFAAENRGLDGALQHALVDHVVGGGPLGRTLHEKLGDPRWSTIWFEQQLVHIARLVVLHADRRPPDEFDQRRLYPDWVTCVVAVTDLLDAGLEVEDHDARLAWEIRQSELNHHAELLATTAIHHELYAVLWPELRPQGWAEVERAFHAMTGMSIADYFTVGSTVMARLVNFANSGDGAPMIAPDTYFASSHLDPSVPQAFFAFTARDVDGLRVELMAEEEKYGPTTYGSLTFERFPLVEAQPGIFIPTSAASLHRRITQGVFHVLAEAAESEGRDRRHYVSAFGEVFQPLVENAVRRGEAARAENAAPITADVRYGGRSNRRRSSDVIVAYERNPVFIEVVSGPLSAATTTRGDIETFRADLQRLVVEKAKQLNRCIDDFLAGAFTVEGADPVTTYRIWPVIVTSHPFPHADTIMDEVRDALRARSYLRQDSVGELAIVSAEDLFFCEGHMEQRRPLLSLLRSWKSGAGANRPFKNELIVLGGGRAPASSYFERRFAEATAVYMNKVIGGAVTPEVVLEQGRGTRNTETGSPLSE
jgi:hypothetical protein